MQVNMKWGFTIGLLFLVLLFSACRQNREEIITKRIQYDVNIKSPDPNYDWWIQNLAGEQREHLVRLLLRGLKVADILPMTIIIIHLAGRRWLIS